MASAVDTSALEALQRLVRQIFEQESTGVVADTHTRIILELTAAGKDYSGAEFHPYNPAYAYYGRLSQGFTTSPKDLRKLEGRLYQLELIGDTLTVPADTKTQKIALGQVTGASGRWGYRHEFLNVSDSTNQIAAADLATYTRNRISANRF